MTARGPRRERKAERTEAFMGSSRKRDFTPLEKGRRRDLTQRTQRSQRAQRGREICRRNPPPKPNPSRLRASGCDTDTNWQERILVEVPHPKGIPVFWEMSRNSST